MRAAVVTAVFPPETVVFRPHQLRRCARTRSARPRRRRLGADSESSGLPHLPVVPAPASSRASDRAEGFRIIHCFGFISSTSSIRSRFAENISFGVTAALRLLFLRKPDVLYLNTWPVFATSLAVAVARLRRIPTIVSVQDVYPESLVSQGRLAPSRFLHRVILAVDRFVVRKAAGVILISPAVRARYSETRGLDQATMHVVPNWLSDEETEESPGAARRAARGTASPTTCFCSPTTETSGRRGGGDGYRGLQMESIPASTSSSQARNLRSRRAASWRRKSPRSDSLREVGAAESDVLGMRRTRWCYADARRAVGSFGPLEADQLPLLCAAGHRHGARWLRDGGGRTRSSMRNRDPARRSAAVRRKRLRDGGNAGEGSGRSGPGRAGVGARQRDARRLSPLLRSTCSKRRRRGNEGRRAAPDYRGRSDRRRLDSPSTRFPVFSLLPRWPVSPRALPRRHRR